MRTVTFISLALLTACGGGQVRPEGAAEQPQAYLDAINRRSNAIKGLTAEIKTEIWRGGKRVRATQLVAVDGQGRLRIDVLSPFGQPLSTLVSDGGRLMIYSMENRRFLVGAATPENLARLVPLKIDPSALSALLRGAIPILAHDTATVAWDATAGTHQLDLRGSAGRQLIDLEPDSLRVVRLRQWQGGSLVVDGRFGDYSGGGDAIIPQRMRFESPEDDLQVDLKVTDFRLDPSFTEATFQLAPPRGVVVEAL